MQRVSDEDPDFLRYLGERGIGPGCILSVFQNRRGLISVRSEQVPAAIQRADEMSDVLELMPDQANRIQVSLLTHKESK
ncbi:MAG: ferrous iron transport protein A [Bifidobacteriales bacterium]|nr:ferrous iron transport protein A [Bifidobacteriales bacterium]